MPRDPRLHPRDDRVRIQHMLEAARDVKAIIVGLKKEDLQSEMMLRRALVNAIQDVGEAAGKVSEQGRERVKLPWGVIVGMRNRLVHGYDTIDLDVVWNVATSEIDSVIMAIEDACRDWPL